jgi:hypothetical protein
MPVYWSALYDRLKDKMKAGREPSSPLILAAWWVTTHLDKRLRFIEHLEWAEAHNQIKEIA